jgi:hypothetical protein
MRTQVQRIVATVALGASIVLAGCPDNSLKISVQGVGKTIGEQNVRVDVVGVSPLERPQWEEASKQEYWGEANNQRRQDAGELGYLGLWTFELGKTPEIVIKEKEKLWQTWKERGATHFLVMFDTCTDAKKWRLCLPLSEKCWRDSMENRTIQVLIQPSGVVSKKAPSPKAACQ